MACLSSRSNNANEDPREGVDDQLKLELLNYLRGELWDDERDDLLR